MNFVYDVDFVPGRLRRKKKLVFDYAHIVYAGVGRTVDFDYIRTGALRDFLAKTTFAARFCRGTFLTVECFCKNSGGGGFSASARTCEKVSVSDFF